MKRGEYWDQEYADYWEARTKEAENSEVKSVLFNDKKVSGLSIYRMLLKQLVLNPNEKVLEIGSGLGHMNLYQYIACRSFYMIFAPTFAPKNVVSQKVSVNSWNSKMGVMVL